MLTVTRHYSHALRHTRVFEGARRPEGTAIIQAHIYQHSDGVWTLLFEGYPMQRGTDGCLIPAPEGTVPWVTPALTLNPQLLDPDEPGFSAWLRNAARMTSAIGIAELIPAEHPPLAPVHLDAPLRNSAELDVLDSPFWDELWKALSFPRQFPGEMRPAPSDWASEAARLRVAKVLKFDPPERVFAWLISFGADACEDGPWEKALLLRNDPLAFFEQLPSEVQQYLKRTIAYCQQEYVKAPMSFNELDLLRTLLCNIDVQAFYN